MIIFALFIFKIYLFIYFWLRWVFVAVQGLSVVSASRGYSLLQCMGFSLRWLLLLWSIGSRLMGFSSCGTQAQLLCSMWDLPGTGLEPVSPALAGRFLTTAPPGKPFPLFLSFYMKCVKNIQNKKIYRNYYNMSMLG